jgi:hypothetical protein
MATYYINADTGNDATGDGSSSNPWLTILHAYGQASTGDEIYAQNSTNSYAWEAIVFGKNITFIGESAKNVVFDATGQSLIQKGIFTYQTQGTYLLKNITFTGFTTSTNQEGAIHIYSTLTINIENCIFTGNNITAKPAGIFAFRNTSENSVVNLTSCLFYNNNGNGGRSIIGNAEGIGTPPTVNFISSTIYLGGPAGEEMRYLVTGYGGTAINIVFKNTIVSNEQAITFNILGSGGNHTETYSCFYNINDSVSGIGVITADPLFIDPANNNYNLSPSSPCIDAGTLI